MILDMLCDDRRIDHTRVLVDHVEEHTVRHVLDEGFWAGMTLYPTTKCTPQRACDIIEMYGPERLLVNSAGDWGPSKPTAVPDFIMEMRRRRHPESVIRKIVYENPLTFFRQSVRWPELKEDDGIKPTKKAAPPSKDKAKPNRMGLVLSDLNDEQKKELDLKSGVVVEDASGTSRGDIQPGDVIVAVISRGATIEAKSADQVNGLIAKLDKGASVTFLLRRGEQQFFSTIKLGNNAE